MVNLERKGRDSLDGFVRTLVDLLIQKRCVFDLVIGPGVSGIAMVKIAEMVYQEINLQFPPKLLIPYYRYTKKDVARGPRFTNNDSLIPMINNNLTNIKLLKNVLFVDDEIGKGTTIRGILQLLTRARPDLFVKMPTFYILAENHGFITDVVETPVTIKFMAFSQKTKGVNNAISHIIPEQLGLLIDELDTTKTYKNKSRMNALFGLPITKLRNGKPVWSNELIDKFNKELTDFNKIQKEFVNYVRDLLRKTIKS